MERERKRRYFIWFCYAMLIVMLVISMTWAKYKVDIEREAYLPEAQGFMASIELGSVSNTTYQFINQLTPGVYSTTDAEYMDFTIYNYDIVADSDTSSTTSSVTDTTISYTIKILSAGNLPLNLYIEDSEGALYTGYRTLATTDSLGTGYQYRFYDENGLEARFYMGNIEEESQAFRLYFTWSAAEHMVNESFKDEIELFEIRAVITAGTIYD